MDSRARALNEAGRGVLVDYGDATAEMLLSKSSCMMVNSYLFGGTPLSELERRRYQWLRGYNHMKNEIQIQYVAE